MNTQQSDISSRTLWERPVLALAAALLVTGALWIMQEGRQRGRMRLETEVTADQAATRLSDWIEDRMSLAGYLAEKWERDYADNIPRYETDAAQFVARFPGFQAINWIDPEEVIRVVVPLAGNELALKADLRDHPFQEVRDAIQRAREQGHPTRTPAVIELLQGGRGFATYSPIFSEGGALLGYINAVFRVDELVETCLSSIQRENKFQVAIRESGGDLVYPVDAGEDYMAQVKAASVSLTIIDQSWDFYLAPSPAYRRARHLSAHHLTIPVGLVLAVVLFVLERVLLQRRLALESSQAQYRALFEDAPVAYFSVNTAVEIESANRVAETLTGQPKQRLIGMSFYDLFPEPGHGRTKARILLDLVRNGEHLLVEEMRMCHRDGTILWVLVSVEAIFDMEQRLSGFRLTVIDVTQRKEAEEARGRLSAAIEQAEEGFAITSETGLVQYVNPAFRAINDRVEGSVLHQPIERLFRSEAVGEEVVTGIESALSLGTRWSGSYGLRLSEGQPIQVVATFSPMRDDGGNVTNFVLLQRDVTYELELQDQLRQAQKMEAVGRLAGGIAHDFNNILQSLLGYTTLARRSLADQAHLERCLSEIERSGRRATDLVAHILAFGRKPESARRVVRLKPIVEEVCELLRGDLPSHISLEVVYDETQCAVVANPTQIHQILMNLAANARHAMLESGGTLTIRLGAVTRGAGADVLTPDLPAGVYMGLHVEDTGIGMGKETLDHLFEPYYTTRVQGDGTGLGLATVHGLVEQHRGAIRVDSTPGEGTSFQVLLPVAPDSAEEDSGESSRDTGDLDGRVGQDGASDVHRKGEAWRILFVDDEPQIVDSMSQILLRSGFHVLGYTRAAAAIDAFRASPDTFDVVVTDLSMPEMNGIGLAGALQEIQNDLPIILCSGYGEIFEEELKKNAHTIRAFLKKPISAHQLCKTIEDVLSEKPDRA